jgi:hypothetical protein
LWEILGRERRSTRRNRGFDIRIGSKSWIPEVDLVSSGSDGVKGARDYLTEGHLAIGVIPDYGVGVDGVHSEEVTHKALTGKV